MDKALKPLSASGEIDPGSLQSFALVVSLSLAARFLQESFAAGTAMTGEAIAEITERFLERVDAPA
jgi:hypothetical protein